MESKKGMLFDDAKQRRGSKLVYLREPWLNLIVADKYKEDTSYAWIEIAKFYATLTAQKKAKKVAIQQDGDTYYWMSFNLIISRLWHYGIRSKSTVSRALHLLCNPTSKSPPLLKRIQKRDSNGHIRLYYAKTDTFDDLFDTDPEWAEDNEFEYKSSDEDDVFDDEDTSSGEIPCEVSKEQPSSEISEGWFPVFAQIRECGLYKDKADRDAKGEVFGYNQKLYTYITEILDGTFYDNSGKNITTRHDLTGLTKEQILEWITKENRIPAGGTDYAHRAIVYITSKATYSPMLNALCGKGATPVKLTKKPCIIPDQYRPELKDPTPSFVWAEGYSSLQNTPDRHYPEFSFDSPMFWGLYREVWEYHDGCTKPDGIWIHNNTSGKPPVSVLKVVMAMLEASKDAGVSYDELIREVKVGVDKNWIWALTIQKVFMAQNSYKIGRGVTGDLYKHLYNAWPLAKEYYKE